MNNGSQEEANERGNYIVSESDQERECMREKGRLREREKESGRERREDYEREKESGHERET